MKSRNSWKLIRESLEKNLAVMLLYVLQSAGSSPGRKGFMMVVNSTGEMEGSLGGGIMEHKFVEMAKARLNNPPRESSIHRQVHRKGAGDNQSGMICSGEQTILLYQVRQRDTVSIQALINCMDQNKYGTLQLSPLGIEFSTGGLEANELEFTVETADKWVYREKIGYRNQLFIIGGGHCALALSRIMRPMDFYIHLFDDRKSLKTMMQNEYAHEKDVLDDYSSLAHRIVSGNHCYVAIMTFGYRTDAIALEALINKNFKYIGLLGSKYKVAKIFADLRLKNNDETAIKKIHAPIGLPIKSQTPEEVAVSIAAQIIKVKNEGYD
ncbi:MAG: XdhC family protein [Chitinophagaceae bacterium]